MAASQAAYFRNLPSYRRVLKYGTTGGNCDTFDDNVGFSSSIDLVADGEITTTVDITFTPDGQWDISAVEHEGYTELTPPELDAALDDMLVGNATLSSSSAADLVHDGYGHLSCTVAVVDVD